MLYGLLELLISTLKAFYRLAFDEFKLWFFIAIGIIFFLGLAFILLGRFMRVDWQPNYISSFIVCISLPLSLFFILLLPASDYLKPAVASLLETWQKDFINNKVWNQETFRKEYWAVNNLKKPDGSSLENFINYPAPENGGNSIPLSYTESKSVISDIDSQRVAEHFQKNFSFLAKLLWTQDRPLPEILRKEMETFFNANKGQPYPHAAAVKIAANEMLSLLEGKIERVVFIVRIILVLLLIVLWLPLYTFALYDAWKKLEPITG
ncbi:MAG: hypothetical protein WAW41_07660 [Methylobacter sp.]